MLVVNWLAGWFVGLLIRWFVGWLVFWLIDCLDGCLVVRLVGWLSVGWLAGWLSGLIPFIVSKSIKRLTTLIVNYGIQYCFPTSSQTRFEQGLCTDCLDKKCTGYTKISASCRLPRNNANRTFLFLTSATSLLLVLSVKARGHTPSVFVQARSGGAAASAT